MNALGHYEKSPAATVELYFGVQYDIEHLTC